ncbi:MAG TPA: FecR domain-containing protein [Gammaproteobacteria bacterium]|nr:FecR domain-containing protein [Gammaproteobacteria bacterium]
MRITPWLILATSAALAACGRSEQPTQAPAVATAPAAQAATVVPAAATRSATPETTAPVATSAADAATVTAPATVTTLGPEHAGSVALAQGSVMDRANDGTSRQLKDGDVVYPGDAFTVGDDSYLDLDLEDGGRILLHPDTSFQIQEYHFDPDAHPSAGERDLLVSTQQKPESSFFNLVKGGLRAVDGLIGQSHSQNYAINTPVATIGVRGTAFDVRYCGDDCKDEADATGAPDNGLYTAVSDGSIAVKNEGGETVTKAGEYSFVQSRKVVARQIDHAPRALRHMSLPAALKARADRNRQLIQQRRQARRQQLLERRQRATGKLKPGVQRPERAKTPTAGKQALTPAERREQRMEERREHNGSRREERREGKQGQNLRSAPQGGERSLPALQEQRQSAPESLRERRQERLQQVQRRREEHQAEKSGAQEQLKRKQQDERACKGKKKRKKHKDNCGG